LTTKEAMLVEAATLSANNPTKRWPCGTWSVAHMPARLTALHRLGFLSNIAYSPATTSRVVLRLKTLHRKRCQWLTISRL